MKKIIITGDFIYHSKHHLAGTILWIYKIFLPIIKEAIGEHVELTSDILNKDKTEFSRSHFYNLGNSKKVNENYNLYNTSNFTKEQISYLSEFFNDDTIVLGFELYKPLTDLLTGLGCKVIDMAYHSFKLFDDLAFGIYTNDINVYDKLLKYKIPQEKFYFYANYWKVFMQNNNLVNDSKLEDNSIAFVGQTVKDKSVIKDGVYLNVSHFEDKLKEYKEKYSKIYYLPHPYLRRYAKDLYKYISKCPYLTLLNNHSTYGLLASEKIKKVVGISTSVLYEAKYFNKEVEYLYKPLFNIDVPFEEHSYISIFEDYWNPKFWADILSPLCETNPNVSNINHFKGSVNKLRNIQDMYWGYAQLDPIKRIPNMEESIKRIYIKYLAKFFE